MLSAGTVINGGLRLIRERPVAVAVWTLLYLAATALSALAMRPFSAMMAGRAPIHRRWPCRCCRCCAGSS